MFLCHIVSGAGSPGLSWIKGRKTVVVIGMFVILLIIFNILCFYVVFGVVWLSIDCL